MSYLNNAIEGEGLDGIVKLSEKSEERKTIVTINGKAYMLSDVRLGNDCFCFTTGWSGEYYDEIEDIRKNIALSSPENTFSYSKHSTFTGVSNSFNFGYVNGEYQEWDDCKSVAYRSLKLECEGIGLIPTYGETDKWGCTRTMINGKEFWLSKLYHYDNCIWFDEAVNGSHYSDGFIEEITRAVGNKTVDVTNADLCTGEELLCTYYCDEATGEVIEEEWL